MMSTTSSYRFRVGTFDCTIVSDGTFAYPHPGPLFFANASPESLQEALQGNNIALQDWENYVSPYPSLVIDTGQQLVLVDTGAGGIAPTTGKLMTNLQQAGIGPGDIDIVILTHGHPDHIGGAVDENGQPAFPTARYVMGREEWEFWTSEPDLSNLQMPDELKGLILQQARTNLPPLQAQLRLVEAGTEILPGIRAVAAPGHTPGHMALSISSGGKRLLVVSDAVIHPLHLEHPEWYTCLDYAPQELVSTRRKLLSWAAEEQALVFAYHFPAPGLGYVMRQGQAWQWQPLDTEVGPRNGRSKAPTAEENKTIVLRFIEEIWNDGDLAAADEIIDANIVLSTRRGAEQVGRTAYKQFITRLRTSFPDVQDSIEEMIAEGDKVMVRWLWKGTHRGPYAGIEATGKHVEIGGITILKIREGKIVEDFVLVDLMDFMEQVGVQPRSN